MSIDNPYHPATPDSDLEASLVRLRPAGMVLTRDTLMFRAGQAAARRHARRWQATTAGLGLALALSLLLRPAATPPQVTYVQVPPQPAASVAQSTPDKLSPTTGGSTDLAYLTLRDRILLRGVDALRSPSAQLIHAAEPLPEPGRDIKPQPSAAGKNYLETFERLFHQGV